MTVIDVPSRVWCRIYGTSLEVWNPGKRAKSITLSPEGVSGLKIRIAGSATTHWIYAQ